MGISGMKEVRLVRDFLKRSKGFAYIDYQKSDQVNKAVKKFNGHLINKRAMFAAPSLPTKALFEECTVFVKNIGAKATEANVREMFAVKGEILGVRMPTDEQGGAHKGYAYVEFSSAESTNAALTLDGAELGGQKAHVTRSIPMKDHRHQTAAARKDVAQRANQKQIIQGRAERADPVAQAEVAPTTIFVKNIKINVNEEKFAEHFKDCGEVVKVVLNKNAAGRSRGFGFLEFATREQAQAALAYNDSVLAGREIWVSKSQRAITLKGVVNGGLPMASKGDEAPPKAKGDGKAGAPVAAKKRLDLGEKKEEAEPPQKKLCAGAEADEATKKQFRAVKSKEGKAPAAEVAKPAPEKEPVVSAKADAKAAAVTEEPKPMSNADFRKLMLG